MIFMNCNEATRAVTDFLERRLRLRDRIAFVMHIVMCRGCRTYLEQIRLTLRGLRAFGSRCASNPRCEKSLSYFNSSRHFRERD